MITSLKTIIITMLMLQMIRRQRFSNLPIQANYYPLSAAGYIQDDKLRLTVITGQPLGATSMASGQFEVISYYIKNAKF